MVCLVPGAPRAPIWQGSTSSTVDLRWEPRAEGPIEKSYSVFWHVTPTVGVGSLSGFKGRSTIIRGLLSNTAYLFHLSAENSAGSSLKSDETKMVTGKCFQGSLNTAL